MQLLRLQEAAIRQQQ
jgi:hypothetical protein